jgi:hypothetical protein
MIHDEQSLVGRFEPCFRRRITPARELRFVAVSIMREQMRRFPFAARRQPVGQLPYERRNTRCRSGTSIGWLGSAGAECGT